MIGGHLVEDYEYFEEKRNNVLELDRTMRHAVRALRQTEARRDSLLAALQCLAHAIQNWGEDLIQQRAPGDPFGDEPLGDTLCRVGQGLLDADAYLTHSGELEDSVLGDTIAEQLATLQSVKHTMNHRTRILQCIERGHEQHAQYDKLSRQSRRALDYDHVRVTKLAEQAARAADEVAQLKRDFSAAAATLRDEIRDFEEQFITAILHSLQQLTASELKNAQAEVCCRVFRPCVVMRVSSTTMHRLCICPACTAAHCYRSVVCLACPRNGMAVSSR